MNKENSYQEQINASFTLLETLRRKAVKKLLFVIIPCSILFYIIFLFVTFELGRSNSNSSWFVNLIFALVGIASVLIIPATVKRNKTQFKVTFKQQVVGNLINLMNNSLSYHPDKKIPIGVYEASEVLHFGIHDIVESEDVIEGKLDKLTIMISEFVHSQQAKVNTRTYPVNIFRGLFFFTTLPQELQGFTYISSEKDAVKSRIKELNKSQYPVMPTFTAENGFTVGTTSAKDVSLFMTPALQEHLKEFYDDLRSPVHIVVNKDRVYVVIKEYFNLFEPRLFTPVNKLKYLQNQLKLIFFLVKFTQILEKNEQLFRA